MIGTTHQDSRPWWPPEERAPEGSPNVVVILLDDVGFASLGCYGSEIETPNLDSLANRGLTYTNFHTTALCSPTRASLLTGRNHHSVGMSIIANADSGYPSKRGAVTDHAGTLAEMLREAGYSTYAVGKWHLAPVTQTSAVGPFDQWPLGRGFEHFYGFLDALTDQFEPELVNDNHRIDPPRTPEEGYTLNEDLVDRAIGYTTDHVSLAPDKPFFMYLAPGATHSPHQAPDEWLKKYRGRYDDGWDIARERRLAAQKQLGIVPRDTKLPARNPGVPAWDGLTDEEKRLFARFQEAYAAFLDHTDHELGRLMRHIEEIGQQENTIYFLMSDNGASQEGQQYGSTSTTFYENNDAESLEFNLERIDLIGTRHVRNNYPLGWAMAANTPLKRYKQNTHAGGVRDPLIVALPKRHGAHGLRTQFHHVTDIVPTILDVVGIEPPAQIRGVAQMPIHGTSMAYTFDKDCESRKSAQYFEMFGHRAIWKDGWKAVAYHPRGGDYADDRWELYHVDADVAEVRDLAGEMPEKLKELEDLWWSEARKYGVLPLDDRGFAMRRAESRLLPGAPRGRSHYRLFGGTTKVPMGASPFILDRSYGISARVITGPDDEGVLVACGGVCGGYTFYLMDGRLRHQYNYYEQQYTLESPLILSRGEHVFRYEFAKTGELCGTARMLVDGRVVDSKDIDATSRYFMDWEGLDVGRDGLSPVSPDYADRRPFAFTGEIKSIDFDLGDDLDGPADYEPMD
nr:arylsulfatase [Microbacterium halotolerans]